MTILMGLLLLGGGLVWRALLATDDLLTKEFKWAMGALGAVLVLTTLVRYDSPTGALISLPFVLGGLAMIPVITMPLTEEWSEKQIKLASVIGQVVLLVAAMFQLP